MVMEKIKTFVKCYNDALITIDMKSSRSRHEECVRFEFRIP